MRRLRRLEDALDQLEAIHVQVARSELFRGYRPVPMALTGALALVAASLQVAVPSLRESPRAFALWWVGVAAVAAVVCVLDLWRAVREHHADALRARTVPVLLQFVPSLGIGIALTVCWIDGPLASMLPALWTVVFGLGAFASRPFLPHAVGWVAAFYLAAGVAVLALDARPGLVPSAWSMGIPFGCGQLAMAFVLARGIPRGVRAPLDEGVVDDSAEDTSPVLDRWEGADGNPA